MTKRKYSAVLEIPSPFPVFTNLSKERNGFELCWECHKSLLLYSHKQLYIFAVIDLNLTGQIVWKHHGDL